MPLYKNPKTGHPQRYNRRTQRFYDYRTASQRLADRYGSSGVPLDNAASSPFANFSGGRFNLGNIQVNPNAASFQGPGGLFFQSRRGGFKPRGGALGGGSFWGRGGGRVAARQANLPTKFYRTTDRSGKVLAQGMKGGIPLRGAGTGLTFGGGGSFLPANLVGRRR